MEINRPPSPINLLYFNATVFQCIVFQLNCHWKDIFGSLVGIWYCCSQWKWLHFQFLSVFNFTYSYLLLFISGSLSFLSRPLNSYQKGRAVTWVYLNPPFSIHSYTLKSYLLRGCTIVSLYNESRSAASTSVLTENSGEGTEDEALATPLPCVGTGESPGPLPESSSSWNRNVWLRAACSDWILCE